jgi:Protein of unknown function (DUF2634).
MIPTGGSLGTQRMEVIEQPSRTWRLDVDRGRAAGMIDGLDAVRQAVFKIFQTERFRHIIYDADYGAELASLIGRDPALVRSELKRRITEALTQDDRIDDVTDYEIDFSEETAAVQFTVVSTFGTFREGVTLHV